MDTAHLGGALLPLDLPAFVHRSRMSADDPGRRRRSVEVDFFSDDKQEGKKRDDEPPGRLAASLDIKKEDLTINVRLLLLS